MRFLLNESTEGEVLSSDGSEFHQVGPMEQNAPEETQRATKPIHALRDLINYI